MQVVFRAGLTVHLTCRYQLCTVLVSDHVCSVTPASRSASRRPGSGRLPGKCRAPHQGSGDVDQGCVRYDSGVLSGGTGE